MGGQAVIRLHSFKDFVLVVKPLEIPDSLRWSRTTKHTGRVTTSPSSFHFWMNSHAASTDVEFKEAATIKEYLADPSKFAAVVVEAVPVAAAAAVEEKKEEAKPESDEDSEDDDMGFGLFD